MNHESSIPIEPLYHYCSSEAFHAIITGRKIRLSALNLSNDTMEGKMLSKIIGTYSTKDNLNNEAHEKLVRHLDRFQEIFCGLGFCLSSEGDLLSQWRGYADNGRGLSIGFSRDSIKKIEDNYTGTEYDFGVSLCQVKYKDDEHECELRQHYDELRNLITSDEYRIKQRRITLAELMSVHSHKPDSNTSYSTIQNQFLKKLIKMQPCLFSLKSSAFAEEKEWRLVSLRFEDKLSDCGFSPNEGKIVPYFEIELPDHETTITEVILGPKHETSISTIDELLKKCGFENVKVKKSKASYR